MVTPLATKIGVKPGHRVRLLHAPAGWAIPDTTPTDRAPWDVTVAFFRAAADLAAEAAGLAAELPDAAVLWVAWPRRAAGHESDLTDGVVRETVLPTGLVDVKVAALGEDWSGLKFVRRVANRRPARR